VNSTSTTYPLLVGNLTASSGAADVSTQTGQIQVMPASRISSNGGNLTIQDNDLANGSILIGAGSTLSAITSSDFVTGGQVSISIGSASQTLGTTPANVSVVTNGAQVYFGSNGITADAPTNTVNADQGNITFSTGGLPGSAIHLAGNVTVSSSIPVLPLANLDFTDSRTVFMVEQYQYLGVVGGTLTGSVGNVTGSVSLTPGMLQPTLTGENIPASVAVTMQNFTSSNPVNISLTATSQTPYISIAGTQQFMSSSGSSQAVMNITSSLTGNAMQISGHLTSDGSMSITIPASSSANTIVINGGTVSATGAVSLNVDGLIINSGAHLSGATINITGQQTVGTGPEMYVSNSGQITASSGPINVVTAPGELLIVAGTSGVWTAPAGSAINLTVTQTGNGAALTFTGGQQFVFSGGSAGGAVTFSSTGSSITVNSGVTLDFPSGNTVLTAAMSTWVNNGTVNLHNQSNPGSYLLLSSFAPMTIANSTGSIDLTDTHLQTNGNNLTILSADSITTSGGTSIDLSSGTGAGGNLYLYAGTSFSPATSGTVYGNGTYTLDGVSTTSGSINLASVAINTSGSTTGGGIDAFARGGSVSLGTITATGGGGAGGNIVVGATGISTGNITTNSTVFGAGTVHLYAAIPGGDPHIFGTVTVRNGTGGVMAISGNYGGNITVGNISSDVGDVVLDTDGKTSSVNFTGSTPIALDIIIQAGAGTVNLPSDQIAPTAFSGRGGGLSVEGGVINYPNSSTQPLILGSAASSPPDGVDFTLQGTTPVTVGTGPGQIELIGYNVAATAGGNLTVNPAGLQGSTISLMAGLVGYGRLLVLGNLSGSTIALESNSRTPFIINDTRATNGVRGQLSVPGGSLNVENKGGSIVNYQAISDAASVSLDTDGGAWGTNGAGGSIYLRQPITPTQSLNLGTSRFGRIFYTGALTAPVLELATQWAPLIAVVDTSQLMAASDRGAIIIRNTTTNYMRIGDIFGSSVSIVSAGTLEVQYGVTSTNGSIRLVGSSVIVFPNNTIQATSKTRGAGLVIEATDVSSNAITIDNGANLSTSGRYAGSIYVGVGSLAAKAGHFPAGAIFQRNGVTVTPTSPPFYFGPNGVQVSAPATIVFDSNRGRHIVFDASGSSSIQIGADTHFTVAGSVDDAEPSSDLIVDADSDAGSGTW
jgi:filamentous hemagglutinin